MPNITNCTPIVLNGLNNKDALKQTYSFRTKEWRYILYLDGSEELYYNKVDPYEWENLAENQEYADQKEEFKIEMPGIINTLK